MYEVPILITCGPQKHLGCYNVIIEIEAKQIGELQPHTFSNCLEKLIVHLDWVPRRIWLQRKVYNFNNVKSFQQEKEVVE